METASSNRTCHERCHLLTRSRSAYAECKIFADPMAQWYGSLMAKHQGAMCATLTRLCASPRQGPRLRQAVGLRKGLRPVLWLHGAVLRRPEELLKYLAAGDHTDNLDTIRCAGHRGGWITPTDAHCGVSVRALVRSDPKQPPSLRTIHSLICLACGLCGHRAALS